MLKLVLPAIILPVGAVLLALLVKLASVRQFLARHARWVMMALLAVSLGLTALNTAVADAHWQAPSWPSTLNIALQANTSGRLLAMALLATTLAALLVSYKSAQEEEQSALATADPLLLATLGFTLLTLLPASLSTVALAWTALDCLLLLAGLLQSPQPRQHLLGWGIRAAGTLSLWGAAISLPDGIITPRGSGAALLLLAVALRLAPLQLGRPKEPASAVWRISFRLAPATGALWLLTQVTQWDAVSALWPQIGSALFLTALAGSGVLAWFSSQDHQAVDWILAGQAGVAILAGLWAGPQAALAEGLVLILAGGILILTKDLATMMIEKRIIAGLAVAALAGLPLVLGGAGRFALYQSWLEQGVGLYLVLAAASYALLLAAAGRLLTSPEIPSNSQTERLVTGLGLALPALGFIGRGGLPNNAGVATWLTVILPLGGAALIAWNADALRPLQKEIEPWLQPIPALNWLGRGLQKGGKLVGRAAHAIHEVVEGEGAFFWVLILLALGWLLLTSGPAG